MITSKIIGTGSFVPKKVISNNDLSKFLNTSDEWIKERTGILKRHIAEKKEGETTSFMALKATENALAMAGLSSKDLDLIIVSTLTSDSRMPNTSCCLQSDLGSLNAPCFDISAACGGSIYGLNIAHNFIISGQCQTVAFVGVETMSSILNWEDRNTAVLFGDGASASILTKSNTNGFKDFKLYADGRQKDVIYLNKDEKIVMNGRETYKFAVRALYELVLEMLKRNNITQENIAYIVPHQANLRIIEAIAQRLNVPIGKFLVNLDKYANTSAASLILAYDEASRENLFKKGDLILMLAIGAGFVYGAGLYEV